MKIGDKIKVNKKYVKVNKKWNEDDSFRRVWELQDIKQTEGIIAGIRVIRDIESINVLDDDGYICCIDFNTTKYIKVALVAINLKSTIYVPL